MPMVTNKSARVIHVDGNMLVPGNAQELASELLERPSVKALIDAEELEVSKSSKKAEVAPAEAAPAAAPARA